MALHMIPSPDYRGDAGIAMMRSVQEALACALKQEDWGRVRHLDRICVVIMDKVIQANRDNQGVLLRALSETKGVYAGLIAQCQHEVSLMANH